MKRINIIYWIATSLFLAMMLFSAVTAFMPNPQGEAMMQHIGVSMAILKLLAVGKILGIIAILVPGYPRLKEWAYAGFAFDLMGACYSFAAAGDPISAWYFILIVLILVFISYFLYHKRTKPALR